MPTLADSPEPGQETMGECTFQFWVDRIESFYCKLDGCSWQSKDSVGGFQAGGSSTWADELKSPTRPTTSATP